MDDKNKVEGQKIITVVFNKKKLGLNLEDAERYVQMGLKYEQILPSVAKMQVLAAKVGQSFEQFCQQLFEEQESRMKADMLQKVNGDEALLQLLVEQQNQKAHNQLKKLDEALKNEAAGVRNEESVKAEFEQIKSDFTMFSSFEMLPENVVKTAVEENVPLKDAVLRYLFCEYKKALAEKDNQQKNKAAGIRVKNSGEDNAQAEIYAMLKGIYK